MSAVELSAPNTKRRSPYARGGRRTEYAPLTRAQLDNRTAAAKMWDALAANIFSDLGGEDNITAVKRELISAFCACALKLNDMNIRGLLGEPVDLGELSLAASTLTRLAIRIGISREARNVTNPNPLEYAQQSDVEP